MSARAKAYRLLLEERIAALERAARCGRVHEVEIAGQQLLEVVPDQSPSRSAVEDFVRASAEFARSMQPTTRTQIVERQA